MLRWMDADLLSCRLGKKVRSAVEGEVPLSFSVKGGCGSTILASGCVACVTLPDAAPFVRGKRLVRDAVLFTQHCSQTRRAMLRMQF